MDFKDTLLLPKTDFPMRGNLPQNEPKKYQAWFDADMYEKMKAKRVGAEMFTLHDGPPYANGDIHIGHALNKILKDIILKYNYFQGKAVRMTPGWDCHGLPIEQKVEEGLGKEKKESIPTEQFRALCRAHAAKYVEIQKEGFKSLGVMADWKNPYVTMDFKFEANIYRTLCEVAKKGLLVERHKPIFWSWAAQTALADAEVEYEDKEDYSIYVHFELSDAAKEKLGLEGKAGIVIWTTTPWTLPANTGIALNPEEMYVLTDDGHIVADARYDKMIEEGVVSGHASRKIAATEMENLLAINPLNGRPSRVVLGSHVLMDGGTGAVHTAPGHGEEDYKVGLKYGLDVVMPVDERGCYDESVVGLNLLPDAQTFVGMHIFKANESILALLGDNLLKVSKFVHSYPHCWRTKKPLIYRATNQWFIAIDEKPESANDTLRTSAFKAIENVDFYPKSAKNRLQPMIEGRPDWCISRQRSWGVPIAFFRRKSTKEVILDTEVLEHIAALFDAHGADAWYAMSNAELLPAGSKYNPDELEKIEDILDVWFDSGSTWNAVLKSGNYDAGNYPASIYIEGSDQHRGWFQSSLLLSAAIHEKSPYKTLITHGFTVDEKGEKMSKSKGNVVAPDKVIKEYGSEILRLWVALSDYQSDLKISDGILKQTAEQYRKIRNTFRFLLANVDDLEAYVLPQQYGELDRWILAKAKEVFASVKSSFDAYDFLRGFATLNHFITNELSGIYMDITKDRLYCDAIDSLTRRATQSAMAHIAKAMLGLVAPVLTYTVDEILEYAPALFKGEMQSVFDLVYVEVPEVTASFDDAMLSVAREKFSEAVDKLKKEKVIKSTLEVEIVGDISAFAIDEAKNLEDWFVVSGMKSSSLAEQLASFEVEEKTFTVHKASGAKCPRCWRFTSVSENCACERCAKVVA
ncbi:MAG TPA: isoleucine--tRNA ligase [Sulfurovum sp.]|jgi:isoleucyl-tRNA synthetase|nr:MAG: isoleucine--tRNA ligase [Sulfurovum sp. 35-42-20]OYZ25115.1 MAG: isoleucine--tRNA ligase [Sulfurovum sp. 16-42-52]OYZ50129.1 MAG: isoleucine--tRNA ligase [Sulfurovum sp. 24-42-9]OZA43695.1 MAG: isoleucine--tRNA ligase [Sulfurovum sp. 17-42-90]OZA60036.1 MAG: isoleucine--tRNA ligase [Sulfurovum sp. 39-42-12]HQR73106.1 isoleucine--tRNA ligase [Sulfurovum sp.]